MILYIRVSNSGIFPARNNSYSPYSKFRVGAAILTETGEIISGSNIENVSIGATICAERTAMVKAVSSGILKFRAIGVASDQAGPCSPCGICRQL